MHLVGVIAYTLTRFGHSRHGFSSDFVSFGGNFYGMKWPWVGAFTDFGGVRYRNPVHFSAQKLNFHVILGFSGLV